MIISHDALHYYEPIPGFKMIAGRDQEFTRGDFRARLAQGQALVNVGEQTFAYYSFWGTGGADGIYLVAWDRDRLGYFSVPWAPEEGQAPTPGVAPQFITCPIRLNKPQARVYLNAEGSAHTLRSRWKSWMTNSGKSRVFQVPTVCRS